MSKSSSNKDTSSIDPVESLGDSNILPVKSTYKAMTIQRKIIIGASSLIVFLIVTAAIILTELATIEDSASSVIHDRQPMAVRFLRFSDNINLATTYLNGYLLTGHTEHNKKFIELSKELNDELKQFHELAQLDKSIIDEHKIKEISDLMKKLFSHANKLLGLRNNLFENYPGLGFANVKLYPPATLYLEAVNELIDEVEELQSNKEKLSHLGHAIRS